MVDGVLWFRSLRCPRTAPTLVAASSAPGAGSFPRAQEGVTHAASAPPGIRAPWWGAGNAGFGGSPRNNPWPPRRHSAPDGRHAGGRICDRRVRDDDGGALPATPRTANDVPPMGPPEPPHALGNSSATDGFHSGGAGLMRLLHREKRQRQRDGD